ncbi:MAG: Rieske 2Fe-2S domain-containing protein [Alphaproteobacteria bacterium]|jgi:nitrite reductase/ring-hydroxylating ferredoxin subunit|nr:Rieske 2Fe-2S domain-containing protein [Alphaproteobacteria bacterium]
MIEILLSDIPDPGAKAFFLETAGGEKIGGFVIRIGPIIRAYVNSCPHTGAPLNWQEDRFLDFTQTEVICTLHGARFTPASGQCTLGPCKGKHLTPLPFEISHGKIIVRPLS